MRIIEYRAGYDEQIVVLVLGIQNDESNLGSTLEGQPDLADIPGTFLHNGGMFWIALEGDEVIGTIGLAVKENSCGILKKFFVHKDWRGKKLGLALYNKLLERAKNLELSSIVLDTPTIAAKAHRFYERAGFRRVEASELPISYDFPNMEFYLYMLDLTR